MFFYKRALGVDIGETISKKFGNGQTERLSKKMFISSRFRFFFDKI